MTADRGAVVFDREGLASILSYLSGHGFRVVGPTVRDGAVVLDAIGSPADLPEGWGDEQAPGRYRLRRREDGALFGYGAGPQSLKPFLFPPRATLWRARRAAEAEGFTVDEEPRTAPRFAFVGVRPCDLVAVEVQDRILLGGDHPDPVYEANRDDNVVVVANCGEAAATCFCASMGTGPRADHATARFDLALTELLPGDRPGDEPAGRTHEFVVEIGTARGEEMLASVASRAATEADLRAARAVTDRAAAAQRRALAVEPPAARPLLEQTLEHPRWDDVASRCLSCTNCTLVCPTCFCSAVEDVTDLAGDAVRARRWDSCFTLAHSYLHGGSVRGSVRARYRQWLTHKLGTWWDQFGTSGCVGCGRCITWCPVGIDITEEIAALAAGGGATAGAAYARRPASTEGTP